MAKKRTSGFAVTIQAFLPCDPTDPESIQAAAKQVEAVKKEGISDLDGAYILKVSSDFTSKNIETGDPEPAPQQAFAPVETQDADARPAETYHEAESEIPS